MSLSFVPLTRVQLVFDALEEDNLFVLGRFAERDDADFIFSLCVNNGHGHAVQEAESNKSLLTILESVVFERPD